MKKLWIIAMVMTIPVFADWPHNDTDDSDMPVYYYKLGSTVPDGILPPEEGNEARRTLFADDDLRGANFLKSTMPFQNQVILQSCIQTACRVE